MQAWLEAASEGDSFCLVPRPLRPTHFAGSDGAKLSPDLSRSSHSFATALRSSYFRTPIFRYPQSSATAQVFGSDPSSEIDGLPSSAVSLVADGESMGCGLAGGCTDAPAPNPSVKSLDVKRG